MTYEDLVTLIQSKKEFCDFVGRIPMEEIVNAEQLLGLPFPEEYKRFVSEYGCGNFSYIEIFGLGVKPNSVPSVIWTTQTLRKEDDNFPKHVLAIENIGDGAIAVLTTEKSKEYGFIAGVILEWSPKQTSRLIADSLINYLYSRFKDC